MTLNVGADKVERQPASAPTRRVVSVIDHLASDVAARPTLADIIRATGMTRATAHAVLTQLCDEGWTVRDDDGRFALAPAFLSRIRDAAVSQPLTSAARPILHALHERLQMPVFLSEFDGESVSVTAIVGEVPWARPDLQMSVTAPLCREYVAWGPPRAQTAWLASASPRTRDRLTDLLSTIRTRGYSIERLGPESTEVMTTLHTVHHSGAAQTVRRRLADLLMDLMSADYRPEDLDAHIPVMSIAVPVRSAADRAAGDRVRASIVACPGVTLSRTAIASAVSDLITAGTSIERALVA